ASHPVLHERGGYVVPGASHPRVTPGARPGRILRAAPQVSSGAELMSHLPCHSPYSYTRDFVSHPNATAQQPAHARGTIEARRTAIRVAGLLQRLDNHHGLVGMGRSL